MINITRAEMTAVFNEWARRYAQNPDEFAQILDADGKAEASYGEGATRVFVKIADEMKAGTRPR